VKRYDAYCREGNDEVVYRNVLFKGIKTLAPLDGHTFLFQSEFVELEEADGKSTFVAVSSIVKFREHVAV
jgi:hypothetical protein